MGNTTIIFLWNGSPAVIRTVGVTLETNIMSNWMMRAAEIHLNILYEELHRLLT
jgi:hypothetical protein